MGRVGPAPLGHVSNREEARLGPKLGCEKAKGRVVAVLGGPASCGPWTALLSSWWTTSIAPSLRLGPWHIESTYC
jgi:hypothetical protein